MGQATLPLQPFDAVARAKRVRYGAGQSVEVEGLGTLATLSDEGSVFGELALFLDDVRSATVRAQSEVRLLRIERKNVMSTLRESWGEHEEMERRAECACRTLPQ